MMPAGARRRYRGWVRTLLVIALAACGSGPADEAFGFVGEVADATQNGSVLGLFVVSSTPPSRLYKLGDGSTVANQFDISFHAEPPADALNDDGVGVAVLGLLPGFATVADGAVDQGDLRLIGLSANHAVIFKTAGAAGPTWSQPFPSGFSCGACVHDPAGGLDTFEPTACDRVVIEATIAAQCAWY
ncbi:MAG: hypothetical protein H6Q90_4379 [Deltaproteobacteria bacterium]|nr:hypothetical protein [Deltaproteobacteria bacterium]